MVKTRGVILQNPWFWAFLALLTAVVLKLWLVAGEWVSFNADEAVVALMARHILQGERPVFFYGQAYMGSLDAILVAVGFALFGQQVWVIRLVQGLLYLGTLATTALLGKQAFDSWRVGVLAMLLLAIPTVNVTLYTTASLGGYGEALLLGNLTLICALHIGKGEAFKRGMLRPYVWWLVLGFLVGLGLWAFGLALVYSIPALLYLFYQRKPLRLSRIEGAKKPDRSVIIPWIILIAGGLLGAAPWLWYALTNGISKLLSELGGEAIAGVERLPWIFEVGQHLVNMLLLGTTVTMGMRPPWDVTWLALPLLPFILMFWMAVVIHIAMCLRHGNPQRGAQALLVGVMVTLVAGFLFTPFGADPSGRYFLPLAIPLALFAAPLVIRFQDRIGPWAYGLVALVLAFNLWGTVQSALRFPPGITTQFYAPSQVDHRYDQALMAFLRQQGEKRGYSNYWVAYPLAFLSEEELIFTPRLPYHLDFRHTERDNRYAPYNDLVAQSDHVAYITTHHPALDERLRKSFSDLDVSWQETQIGDYHIFYALSRPVRPEDIGLGVPTP